MKHRIRVVLVLAPLILWLTACAPVSKVALPGHHHHHSASPTASASRTPTPTPTVAPTIDPADYLIDGTPNVPDSNGEWFGEWAFFTDATKSVWCEFTIFSGDNPAGYCLIVPSAQALRTYSVPAGVSNNCDQSANNAEDGYSLELGGDPLIPNIAGWGGCSNNDYATPAHLAASKVLPAGGVLTEAPFSCTVASSVATCTYAPSAGVSGTITLGLHVATFSQVGV